MRKIISICSLVISVALIVTLFTACGGDGDDGTTAANTTAASAENNVTEPVVIGKLTLEVLQNEAVVYNDGNEFRKLIYPDNKNTPFVFDYAKEHYDFIDMNFDGNTDVYIAVADDNGIIYYYCYLYNATTTMFDYSASLSALNNISVDVAEQLIFAVGYDSDGNRVISKYTFADGVLSFIESYNEADEIPEDVQQSAGSNAIGDKVHTDKPDTQESTSSSDSVSETKPLLTTEANSGGIILETDPSWY